MGAHEHSAFGCRGGLIDRVCCGDVVFEWAAENKSKNVLEFVVESLVEENVKTRINGAVGVRQEEETRFHVSDSDQLFISVREKIDQEMHDVRW